MKPLKSTAKGEVTAASADGSDLRCSENSIRC